MTILDNFNAQKLKAHKELLYEIYDNKPPAEKLEKLKSKVENEKNRRQKQKL